jgi:hypothetical protein
LKGGKEEENVADENEDKHFDDWQGVNREGQNSNDEHEKTESEKEEDDDDDGPDGGEMMPIPEGLVV